MQSPVLRPVGDLDGWMDRWMDGWVDRQIDRQINRQTAGYRDLIPTLKELTMC